MVTILAVLAAMGGCASPRIPFQDMSFPALNTESTANLGDRLLMQGRGYFTDIVHVGNLRGKYGEITAGDYCRLPGSDEFFSFNNTAIIYYNFLGGHRGYDNTLEYKPKTNEVCLDDMWSGCFDTSFGSISFEAHGFCSDPNSYQQIIEYNGKAGDVLNFTYREFNQHRINAPYTTNFTMDQKDGDTVTYKGALLKVIEATNQKIDYVVVRNFNNAIR